MPVRTLLPRRRPRLPIQLAILVGLGFGVLRALLSGPTLTFAADELAKRLHDELGLTLVIAHIEAQARDAAVVMGPVILKGTDGAVLLAAREVRARVAPLKVFERRLRVEELEVIDPQVRLRIVDGAIAGVRTLVADGSDAPLFRLDVARFALHGGAVDLEVSNTDLDAADPSSPPPLRQVASARLSGIEVRLRDRGRDEHRLTFSVARAEVRRPGEDTEHGEQSRQRDHGARAKGPASDRVIPIDAFSGRLVVMGNGLLAPERILVSEVTLATDGAEASLAGTVRLGAPGLLPAFEADLHARADLLPALRPLAIPIEVHGIATLNARLSAQPGGQELQGAGQLDVSQLTVGSVDLGSLRARLRGNRQLGEVIDARWDWADTTLHARGHMRFDDSLGVEVHGEAQGLSMYRLLEQLNVRGSWAEAHLDGAVDLTGTLRPFTLEGRGSGTFTDVAVAAMDLRRAAPERVTLKSAFPIRARDVVIQADDLGMRFSGEVDDGRTRAKGDVVIPLGGRAPIRIEAVAERADFASIGNRIGGLTYSGAGRGTFRMDNEGAGVVLTSRLDVEGFALADFAFGDTSGALRFHRGVLTLDELVAQKDGDTRYGGSVVLEFADGPHGPSPQLALDLSFDLARAETLRRIIPAGSTGAVLAFLRDELDVTGPVRGHVTATGAVGGGSFDHMQGHGALELLDGATLLAQSLTGTATFELTPDTFNIDPLEVRLGRHAAEAGSGRLTLAVRRREATLEGTVDLVQMPLAQFDALRDTAQPFMGTVDVTGQLGGPARNPAFVGTARLRNASYGAIPIGDADLALTHADRQLTLRGPVLSGRGAGLIHVETRQPFAYDASIRLARGPLGPLLPPGAMPKDVAVTLAGDVEARGALKTFRDSRGTIALDTLDLNARGVQLKVRADAAAHFHGTRLTLDLLDLITEEGDLLGVRGLVAHDVMDLQLSSNGSLALLSRVWPTARSARGRYNLDVAVTGTPDRAAMSGQAFVSGGSVVFDDLLPPLEDIDARVAFRGAHVIVERASARAGSAKLNAQGAVTLEGLAPHFFDLEARFSRLPLRLPGPVQTVSSGRLALKGDANLPTLSGEVKVHSARYTEDINWERLLPDLRRRGSAPGQLNAADEDLRFDVHLMAERGGIVVENNVIDLEAKGDLFLTGTEERPGLRGGLQLIRGHAIFRGNRYRLTRGTMDFMDTNRIEPILDLEAETRVQDYDITAHLTGRARTPAIALRSQPDLSDVDIVSLLTFGFTQFDIKDAGGSAGAAGLEMVSAYTGLDKELRRVLPEAMRRSSAVTLDELRLTSQFSLRAGASIPAVALGMEVNPGVWGLDGSRLRLQSTLIDTTGNGTEQRVEWEKRFDNNVRLRMMWSSEDDGSCPACTNQWGDLGGDLWYRWEF